MIKQNDQDDQSNLRLISVIWIVCGLVMVVGSTVILNMTQMQSYLARGVMIRLFCPRNGWRVDWRLVLHQVKQKNSKYEKKKQIFKFVYILNDTVKDTHVTDPTWQIWHVIFDTLPIIYGSLLCIRFEGLENGAILS